MKSDDPIAGDSQGEMKANDLAVHLKSLEVNVALTAAESLAKNGDMRGVRFLLNQFDRRDLDFLSKSDVRNRSERALRNSEQHIVENLITYLQECGYQAELQSSLRMAIGLLGELGDKRATETVASYLDTYVAREAADALVKLGVRERDGKILSLDDSDLNNFEALADGLTRGTIKIQEQAAVALGKLGDRRAEIPLKELLRRTESDIGHPGNRVAAQQALEVLRSASTISSRTVALSGQAKIAASALKLWYRDRAAMYWKERGDKAATCDDGNDVIKLGEGYLRPGGYLCCEEHIDRFLCAVDWGRALPNLDSFFGPGIPDQISKMANKESWIRVVACRLRSVLFRT